MLVRQGHTVQRTTPPRFHRVRAPTHAELQRLLHAIATRITRARERQRLLPRASTATSMCAPAPISATQIRVRSRESGRYSRQAISCSFGETSVSTMHVQRGNSRVGLHEIQPVRRQKSIAATVSEALRAGPGGVQQHRRPQADSRSVESHRNDRSLPLPRHRVHLCPDSGERADGARRLHGP